MEVPLNCPYMSTRPHSTTFQQTLIFNTKTFNSHGSQHLRNSKNEIPFLANVGTDAHHTIDQWSLAQINRYWVMIVHHRNQLFTKKAVLLQHTHN